MPKVGVTQPDVIYLGIDPGKKGGITTIYRGEPVCTVMPETELDIWNCLNELTMYEVPIVACIEHVTTSPQMGVVSAGTFMYGYGCLRMALTVLGASTTLVRPQLWQKVLGIPPKKKKEPDTYHKHKLRAHAQRLYPGLPIWTEPRSKGRQMAVCDALLIAHYCKLVNTGGTNAKGR